jgi:hypothetical protein
LQAMMRWSGRELNTPPHPWKPRITRVSLPASWPCPLPLLGWAQPPPLPPRPSWPPTNPPHRPHVLRHRVPHSTVQCETLRSPRHCDTLPPSLARMRRNAVAMAVVTCLAVLSYVAAREFLCLERPCSCVGEGVCVCVYVCVWVSTKHQMNALLRNVG